MAASDEIDYMELCQQAYDKAKPCGALGAILIVIKPSAKEEEFDAKVEFASEEHMHLMFDALGTVAKLVGSDTEKEVATDAQTDAG